jgi:polyisoprenoid-binding protein YceI
MSPRFARACLLAMLLGAAGAGGLAAQQPAPPAGPGPQGPPPAPLPPNGWRVDPGHSAIGFRVRHLGISWVNGKFGLWSAELVYDPANPEAASVTARIPMTGVNTGSDRRDADIRANYFVVDSFPEMTFISRSVERAGEGRLRVTGDLTLHGVTRPVVLEAEVTGPLNTSRGRRVAFTATTTISRRDFGMLRNPVMEGAQVVGDEIRITIDIEAVQPSG